MQLAFHPRLVPLAPAFCDALNSAFRLRQGPCSVAVSLFPDGPGETSFTLSGPRIAVCVDRREALAGPLWDEGAGTCPACFDYWVVTNAVQDCADPTPAPDAASVAMVIDVVDAAFRGGAGTTAYSIAQAGGSLIRHTVNGRRDCPRCGASSPQSLPLDAHCSRRTGIVAKLELTDRPVAGAFRATAVWTPPLPAVAGARPYLLRQQAYGRGHTPEDAFRSCLGEALERYTLVFRGNEPLVRATYEEDVALHPDRIQLFSESQFDARDDWNSSADELFWVPERFDRAVEVDWLQARQLGKTGRPVLVPAACCLMWYEFKPGEPEFGRADTIGCAAGPTLDAAITHGLLEWIERDALAIWWENRLRRPAVTLESFDDPHLLAVREGLEAIGRTLVLLDCTTDIGIPVYVAVAARTDGSEPLVGAAAHPHASVAAYRAASEVGQVWYEANRSRALSQTLSDWLLRETTDRQPYLQPLGYADAPSANRIELVPGVWPDVVERLASAGLDAFVVDHSRSDVGVRTARCIVPGLRHVWNRRAPGRLYDVPVAMGWLASPTPEDQLNPVRCMI
jgi:thiazole/oxazole-forming peptide maturase SagD family component